MHKKQAKTRVLALERLSPSSFLLSFSSSPLVFLVFLRLIWSLNFSLKIPFLAETKGLKVCKKSCQNPIKNTLSQIQHLILDGLSLLLVLLLVACPLLGHWSWPAIRLPKEASLSFNYCLKDLVAFQLGQCTIWSTISS